MKRCTTFLPAARRDFLEACSWYEEQRAGLGGRFEAAVERALELIATAPESFPAIHRDVRRVLVRPFPYGLFYRVRDDSIRVLAVMHGGRDPARWKSRADTD